MNHLMKLITVAVFGTIVLLVIFSAYKTDSTTSKKPDEPQKLGECKDKSGAVQIAREYITGKTNDKIIRFDELRPGTAMLLPDNEHGCIGVVFSNYCFKSAAGEKQRNFRVGLRGINYKWTANDHAFDILSAVKPGCPF